MWIKSPTCLKFKAHMYGKGIGSLTVSKVKRENSSILYTKSGSQSQQWFDVMVDIPVDRPYQVSKNLL